MSAEPLPSAPADFKDRKTGLIVFGVFEILLGCFFVLSGVAAMIGQVVMSHRDGASGPGSVISVLVTNGGLAALAITLGIGTLMACRWARAIGLCVGWLGLIMGIVGSGCVLWMLPHLTEIMRQSAAHSGQDLPPLAIAAAKVAMVGFILIFYVLIPGAAVLFYRSRHVKATCEARHPISSWTDRCPLPVLALSLLQAFGALSLLGTLPHYGRAFPLFGLVVTGIAARLIYLGLAALAAWLAWGFYRLQRGAWATFIALTLLSGINSLVMFSGHHLMALYEAQGLPEAQLQQIKLLPLTNSVFMTIFTVFSTLAVLGYLWWLRKFFPRAN